MPQIDMTERQVTLKLVYYGPPLSGKTTNLRSLHARVDPFNRGRLMTLDTKDDRTLFFDLLPLFFRASGLSFRIKMYTVPGQPVHEATRRVVLAGADGIVFVADSDPAQADNNATAYENLRRNLATHGLERLPIVIQYNKRDLPNAVDLATCPSFDSPRDQLVPASAVDGDGVVRTFLALVSRVWDGLARDLKLTENFAIDGTEFRSAVAAFVGSAP